MKKTLFLLLFPFALFSQTDTTTTPIDTIPEPPIVVNPPTAIPSGLAKDTIYSKVIDGYFYIVRRNVQDNGSYSETSEFVGDTTALIDRAEGIIVQNSDVLYKAAILVLNSQRYWEQAIRDDQVLSFAYGQSPLTQIQQSYDAQFLTGQYALNSAAGAQSIVFTRNEAGKLTAAIAGGDPLVDHLVGQSMRIENFTPAGALNFYKASQGLWINAEKTHAIQLIGQ